MKIKVPFKSWKILTEKDVDFEFRIGTLEDACEYVLNCDIWEIETQNQYDVSVAILYSGYVTACEKLHKRKKYNLTHAIFWLEHMSKDSQAQYLKAMQDLLGKMKGKKEKKK